MDIPESGAVSTGTHAMAAKAGVIAFVTLSFRSRGDCNKVRRVTAWR